MKKYLLITALSFSSVLWAQGVKNVTDPVVNNQFGYLTQIPSKPANVVGSVYLNEDWRETTLTLKKEMYGVSQFVRVRMKLDLKTNVMEFQTDNGLKVIGAANVRSFAWKGDRQSEEETYLNCDRFSFGDTKLQGFARVIGKGKKLSLLEYPYLEYVSADYNVALDVGSKDQKYLKKNKLYLLKDSQLITVTKKSIMAAMADKKQQVIQYKKDQELNLKETQGLAALVSFYNAL